MSQVPSSKNAYLPVKQSGEVMAASDALEALEAARLQYNRLLGHFEELTSEYETTLEQLEKYRVSTSKLESRLHSSNRKLENAQKIQNEFLDTISHEFLTPLNGILGMARLLNDIPIPKEAKESVEIIQSCGENLEQILRSVLDFLHLSKGEIEFINSTFDPIQCIESLIDEYALSAYQKDLEITYIPLHREYEAIELDKDRFRQIVHILLSNAIKFTQAGHVIIESKIVSPSQDSLAIQSRHELHLRVTDSGIGISPEKKRDIFRPFEQIDSSNNRNYGGVGIGLTLAKEIITQMDGAILIDSVPDKGSTFFVSLPLDRVITAPTPVADTLPLDIGIAVSSLHPPHQKLFGYLFKELNIPFSFIADSDSPDNIIDYSEILLIDYPSDNQKAQQQDRIISTSSHRFSKVIAFVPPEKKISPQIKPLFDVIIPKPITLPSLRNALDYTASWMDGASEVASDRTDKVPTRTPVLEKVLLVEDSLINQKIVMHLLGMLGLTVEHVQSLDEMKAKLRTNSYSHIVINPSIDPTSNLSLIYLMLNATKIYETTRLVAITGKKYNITEEQIKGAGFHTHIELPSRLDNFAEALQVNHK